MFHSQKVCCLLVLVVVCEAFQAPARKTWWAKRVLSDDFYTAGRLTQRMIKYASEDGFKSLISLFSYDDAQSTEDTDGYGLNYPSTAAANATAELAGIRHVTLLGAGAEDSDWMTAETLDLLKKAIKTSPKPLIVYDHDSYASMCLLLLYFAAQNNAAAAAAAANAATANAATVKLTPPQVFSVAAGLGYDCSGETFQALVAEVTKETVTNPVTPDVNPRQWYKDYWPAKFLHKNWFVAGQVLSSDLALIQNAGFTRLFNYRKGKMSGETPTQEEVTLLNIKDRVGTYTGDGRQSTTELLKNRIDPDKSTAYISDTSTTNYEARNPWEYGDEIGYNEETEKQDIPTALQYTHLPLGGQYTYNEKMWEVYGPIHAEAQDTPVLLHCRTGFRSSVISIIQIAYADKKNSTWALDRLKEIGYDIADKAPTAVTLYEAVLDDRSDEDDSGSDGERCVFNFFLVASLSALLLII